MGVHHLTHTRALHTPPLTSVRMDCIALLFRVALSNLSLSLPLTLPHDQAYRAQLSAFLREVRSVNALPTLKQYLLLYSSIPLTKLASLIDVEEGALRTNLLNLKAKSYG